MIMTSVAATEALTPQDLASLAAQYSGRPRASSGAIAALALERLRHRCGVDAAPDCGVLVARLVASAPVAMAEAPAAKRARTETQLQSVRLRQILVRHKDAKHPVDPVKNRAVTHTRAEAEALLRDALLELMKDGDHRGDSMWAAKSTPRILDVCRKMSECKSALKGGSMCGDIGWLGKKELQALGKETEEAVRALAVAEWSDLLLSDHGVHLMMRIA